MLYGLLQMRHQHQIPLKAASLLTATLIARRYLSLRVFSTVNPRWLSMDLPTKSYASCWPRTIRPSQELASCSSNGSPSLPSRFQQEHLLYGFFHSVVTTAIGSRPQVTPIRKTAQTHFNRSRQVTIDYQNQSKAPQ